MLLRLSYSLRKVKIISYYGEGTYNFFRIKITHTIHFHFITLVLIVTFSNMAVLIWKKWT